jgi:NAD-dependent dihydropyrimidine dehydrogenase PreA subunit
MLHLRRAADQPRRLAPPLPRAYIRGMAITLDIDLCEGTGVCEQVCPEDVFEHTDGKTRIVQPSACTDCFICVENCVASALTID